MLADEKVKELNQLYKQFVLPVFKTVNGWPGQMANDVVWAIRHLKANNEVVAPMLVYLKIRMTKRDWYKINPNSEEFEGLVRYYEMWEQLSKREKKYIHSVRYGEFNYN